MTDERIVQRLEEQLRDAHATNADLRERLGDVEQREKSANAIRGEGEIYKRQLEQAHAKQKAAEDNAAAAQRKQAEAERELQRARAEIEELEARLSKVSEEAALLTDANERIAQARGVADLLS